MVGTAAGTGVGERTETKSDDQTIHFEGRQEARGGAEKGTRAAKCREGNGKTSLVPLVRAHNLLVECR